MKKAWYLFVILSFISIGCASTGGSGGPQTAKFTPIQKLGAPDWVLKGSGAFGGDKGKAFYGAGSASNSSNVSLMRSSADNRARNEIAKTMQIYTASLMKDYQATTSADANLGVADEQHIEQAIKTVTTMTLSGAEIVDHWQNPETGEFYSLARLDLNSVKDTFDKAKELNAKVKEYVRQNADKLHDQLEKEEEKLKEPAK